MGNKQCYSQGSFNRNANIRRAKNDMIIGKFTNSFCMPIVPLPDGNGWVGRLIMFKECLKYNIVPFIIDEMHKLYYYKGLKEFEKEKGYLIDTCLSALDRYKEIMAYYVSDA